ncbi:hypothetical protein BDR06DRAFT_972504 [Suillus hirtellus]|nr:hypothetical protein BDR06DRAFT_972504 [Suillus hirtellus]
MRRVHQMMYEIDSEEEDGPGHKDSTATTDAGKGGVVLADPQPEPAAQPANPAPIELSATMVAPFSPPEVMPSVASQHEGSEQPQPSNGTLQTTSSPSTPSNDENGSPQAQSMDRPSSHPTGEKSLPQPEPLHTDPHIEAVNRYAHSPLLQRDAPITREAPSHMHELPRYPREPSVPLREPLLHPRAPSVPSRDHLHHSREPSVPLRGPLLHPHEASVPLRDHLHHSRDPSAHSQEGPSYPHDAAHYREVHDSLYDQNSTIHTHPHPTSSLNPHGLPRTRNVEEAQYARVPMGYGHYPSRYDSPGEGYDDRYDDRRHPSDFYYQDMRGHDGRYYGDTNRWADRR